MTNNQFFNQPVIEIIKARTSVRGYQRLSIPNEVKAKLVSFMNTQSKGIFHHKTSLRLVDNLDLSEKTGGKIGTYGVIRGATTYIAAITEPGDQNLIDLGYCLEKLILYATSIGLGTCWLGGTFNRGGIIKGLELEQDQILPAITPIGYPEAKKTILDRMMRRAAGSDNRKPWKELFFNRNHEPLGEKEAGKYAIPLEMVRIAPSASNKQPWRIVKDDKGLHLYLKGTLGYNKTLGFNIQQIDMGIAMCHLEMTLVELGIEGSWQYDSLYSHSEKMGDTTYIVSWIEAN